MKELIDKFPNGQELYNTNAIFNSVVNSIYKGLDLYSAISIIAEINVKQQKIIEELVMKMPMQPIIYTPNE